ncbi:MAG: deoxyribonuclease V [Syntrophobacterales bacterium]|nr:MAG: deoxyribonuclease V [Syntrophobacterales bacterium]
MRVRSLHPWNVNYREAIRIQEKLRAEISLINSAREVRSIAGADVSYSRDGGEAVAAMVVLSYPDLDPIDEAFSWGKISFPYIPGLLSFREAPLIIEAFQRLQRIPDVVLYDGQGIAHIRSFGLAAHMGVLLDLPSVGCAKKKLVGDFGEVGLHAGSTTSLKIDGKIVGAVIRTRRGVKPVFVSPGHRIDLQSSIGLVLKTCRGFRLPEPIRRAHLMVKRIRSLGGTAPTKK